MKKTIFAAFALVFSLLALNSCLKDDGNVYHQTSFYPQFPNGIEVYADQSLDSTYVLSTDSWVATLKGQGTEAPSWLKISPERAEVKEGYLLQQRMLINLEPNTTGKSRRAYITVSTPDYGEGSILMPVTQYAWLNITAPTGVLTPNNSLESTITFTANLVASDKKAIMRFTVYNDATISSDAAWFQIPEDQASLKPGSYAITFLFEPNDEEAAREAHVTLTSGGISNTVNFKQAGKK